MRHSVVYPGHCLFGLAKTSIWLKKTNKQKKTEMKADEELHAV